MALASALIRKASPITNQFMARVVVVGGGFGGLSAAVRLAKLHHEDVGAPSAVQIGIPPYVDALVARATTRDRNERPEDARALLRMVRRVQRAIDQGLTDDPKLTSELMPPRVVERDDLPDEATIAVSVPSAPITLDKSDPLEDGLRTPIPPLFPTNPPVPGEPTVA